MSELSGARVLVTGERGRIGSAVAARLRHLGADVVGASLPEVDTRDPGALVEAMAGMDRVVHLAAIPNPDLAPWPEVFGNNVTSTFNVLWAAAEHGIGRAVIASSINASGLPYNSHPVLPAYFPLDEQLPSDIDDPYSLSKTVDEQTAQMAARHWGINVACIRFPFTGTAAEVDEHARMLTDDPAAGLREGWTYLDVRDAARVVEAALLRGVSGAPAIFVSADQTCVPYATEELLAAYAPSVPRRQPMPGREVPADLTRARELLGFRAEHTLDLTTIPLPAVRG